MNNFGHYTTPEAAKKFGDANGDAQPLAYWERLARRKAKACENACGEREWKYGRAGLCFSCTTGEADASDDSEIAPTGGEAS